MRAGVGAGSQFGRRSCSHRSRQVLLGRGAETEAHINEAFRLSPRDTTAYRVVDVGRLRQVAARCRCRSSHLAAPGLEANRNYSSRISISRLLWRGSASWTRRGLPCRRDLRSIQRFTIRRYRGNPSSDNPTYLAGRERRFDGMRMAGVPEG